MTSSNENNQLNDTPNSTREQLFEVCREIAEDNHILGKLAEELRATGFAGDVRRPQLTFLTSYTRFENKPVSLCFKGTSAAGKSSVVEWPLSYVPETAYHKISGMSEKALQYAQVDLRHKHIIIGELAGLQSTGGNKWLRMLLSEGALVYDVVEADPSTGKRVTSTYRTEGPTGVIMTTTEDHLHPEDETRFISVLVDDGAEQTRAVMLAQAEERGQGSRRDPNPAPWHALHEWIASNPEHVTIPYARKLAEQIDPSDERIKRDFPQVLSLIRAHARLHQANRARTEDGRIVATLADYEAVHNLLGDALEVAVGAKVEPQIIRVFDAVVSVTGSRVEYADGVPQHVITEKITGDASKGKGLVSKWTNRAVDGGYLVNDAQAGHPKKLLPGEPIPGQRRLLPTPEELKAAIESDKDAAE